MPTETSGRILLLTGVPGIGKTTLLRDVARRLAHRTLRGFYTEEMREHGERVGFRLVTFDGEQAVIAHIDFRGFPHVSKYGVDVAAIDAVATRVLTVWPGVDVYLVDEMGKMECLSASFVRAMRALLASDKVIIATIAAKGAGFIAEVKKRDDILLREVTRANRVELPEELVQWIEARCR
jgi:nucleoside-triphosphatase